MNVPSFKCIESTLGTRLLKVRMKLINYLCKELGAAYRAPSHILRLLCNATY
jgi:hypothetical protein